MAVRRFHHIEIEAVAGLDVGEGLETCRAGFQERAVGAAAEHPVHNRYNLGARDCAVRVIGRLAVGQPAVGDCRCDVLITRDRRRDVGELHRAFLQREEAGCHGAELRAGDRLCRLECAVRVAGDYALACQRLDCGFIPLTGRNIGERNVRVHRGVEQQTIENRCGFRAAQASLRAERAVRPTPYKRQEHILHIRHH